MGAVLAVVVCGGGCLAGCWLMMRRMHRGTDVDEPGRTGSAPLPEQGDDPSR